MEHVSDQTVRNAVRETCDTDEYYGALDGVIEIHASYVDSTYIVHPGTDEVYRAYIGTYEIDLTPFSLESKFQAVIAAAVMSGLDKLVNLYADMELGCGYEYAVSSTYADGIGFANDAAVHELYKGNKEHEDRALILRRAVEAVQLDGRNFITDRDVRLSAEALSFEMVPQ